jgi:Cytochrome C oxidase, cbb3-type, subunit III
VTRAAAALAALVLAGCGGSGDGDAESGAGGPPLERGAAVWAQHGCGGCHAFAAARSSGQIGPNLDTTLEGRDLPYIRRSIVDPAADGDRGYYCAGCVGGMPRDFAKRIPPGDLEALVRFVAEGTR